MTHQTGEKSNTKHQTAPICTLNVQNIQHLGLSGKQWIYMYIYHEEETGYWIERSIDLLFH